jgi:hypothetical protein
MYMCVRVRVRVRACACVRACVSLSLSLSLSLYVYICVSQITVQVLKTIHDFPPELEGDLPEEGAIKFTGLCQCIYVSTCLSLFLCTSVCM